MKRIRGGGPGRLKGDGRILDDTDFVLSILSEAEERLERKHELKSRGFDLERVEKRIEELLGIEARTIYSKGRRKDRLAARSLFCYWAVRELGLGNTSTANKLGMSQPWDTR